ILFFFSSRRRHTRWPRDWSSDVCSSDLWLCFPYMNDPSLDLRFAENCPVHGRLDTDFLPTHLHKSITSRALTLGGNRQDLTCLRSEERRVGKECRAGWWAEV